MQYLLALVVGSTALGAWIAHRDTGARATEAVVAPSRRMKVEIVRVPAATSPARAVTQPATRPGMASMLPPEFAIFRTRNAFAHGKGGANAGPAGPEAGFVLRGVVQAGERVIAFVEDKAANRVSEISAGQTFARGKITGVTLEGVVYQASGPARQIKVGQDLSGQAAPPTPTTKPAAAQPGSGVAPPGPHVQPGPASDQPMPVRPSGKQRVLKNG
jgi:hypothetical protein